MALKLFEAGQYFKDKYEESQKENEIKKNDKNGSNFKNGFVYIIKDMSKNNVYKIGKTLYLTNRLKALKTGNPFIQIIASLQSCNYAYIENFLHEYLENKNILNEWFELNEKELNEIINDFGFNRGLTQGSL